MARDSIDEDAARDVIREAHALADSLREATGGVMTLRVTVSDDVLGHETLNWVQAQRFVDFLRVKAKVRERG